LGTDSVHPELVEGWTAGFSTASNAVSPAPWSLSQTVILYHLLLTPCRLDGILPCDSLPTAGFAGQSGRGIPTANLCLLGIEVEDHIQVSVSIDILKSRLDWCSFRTGLPKADRGRGNSGGIKGGRRQDSHRDLAVVPGVDAIGKAPRLDVDRDRTRHVGCDVIARLPRQGATRPSLELERQRSDKREVKKDAGTCLRKRWGSAKSDRVDDRWRLQGTKRHAGDGSAIDRDGDRGARQIDCESWEGRGGRVKRPSKGAARWDESYG